VTYQAKHPAAFINNIADEGTKAEALEWLQRTWDDNFALQARIDALMLEYCPDEMTPLQRARWAASQRRAGLETKVVVDRGRPGGDMTAEATFTHEADGSLRVIDVKCYEPPKTRHPDCRCNEGYECDRCANIRIARSALHR
jgi:hypothetical protein